MSEDAQRFACPLCDKQFARRDLMARHHRRCQNASKTSKRKACDDCVRTKSKCCLTRPACSRCLARRQPCSFQTSSQQPVRQHDADTDALLHSLQMEGLQGSTSPIIWSPRAGSAEMPTPGAFGDLLATPKSSMHPALNAGGPPDLYLPDWSSLFPQALLQGTDLPSTGSDTMPPFFESSSGQGGRLTGDTPSSAASSTSSGPRHLDLPLSDKHRRTFTHEDLLTIVCNYADLLMEDDYRSPLVHHTLYAFQGSYGDITAMVQSRTALCYHSATANERSARFARRATAAQRERLMHEFLSCVEEWDALHAMLIYQISALLDNGEGSSKTNMKAAEIHIPFLLKMARIFRKNHSQELSSGGAANWASWLVAETVRRTLFMVNIINILTGSDENGRASYYYEPLDDDYIFSMPLPAPNDVWGARSATEWRDARERSGWSDELADTLDSIKGPDRDQVLARLYSAEPGLSSSSALRDLIIACHLLL
ncbi:putative C6 finger domain protein [Lasiodiplodia theobromae]|uniref:putative C6 finger domain protein n=1 Tax=Lasiodiplodia theobromae TaxID=45133 RepID=UPI0015C3669D|nr:putative C6 finger domain protein [Lasiodiplodia theobromae]KAF4538240.1 putative C6 finger domain protein [Lasiodiplodia theobromae]